MCGSALQTLVPEQELPMERAALCSVKPGTRCQGKGEREYFKLASLTKPEFHKIMGSVDLVLYKMKGKFKPIKHVY